MTPILPLCPEILTFLTRAELSKCIRFEVIEDGLKVKLSFQLPKDKGDYEIERVYRISKDEVVRLDNVPILEIWPNFINQSWRGYHVYYDSVGRKNTFYAKPTIVEKRDYRSFINKRGEVERG